MKVGSRVSHKTYGTGEITRARDRGASFRVEFPDQPDRGWIAADELIDLSRDGATPTHIEPEDEVTTPATLVENGVDPATRFASRRLVEALRLGIVPRDDVTRFTFGRDIEKWELFTWLGKSEGNFRILVGEYGAGKTHFLECVRAMALDEGYAVAMVSLEPNETPLYRPKRIYHRLMQSLEYLDASRRRRGFREFLLDAARKDHTLWRNDYYLRQVHQELKSNRMEDYRWDWLSGSEVVKKEHLYDDAASGSIYCHLLTAISVLASECLDLKGLLLLFDEAEMLDVAVNQTQLRRGFNFLRGLQFAAENDPRLLNEEIDWKAQHLGPRFGYEIGPNGAQTKLRYSGRLPHLRFTAGQPVALKIVLAFAPATILDAPPLSQWNRIDLAQLGAHPLAQALIATMNEYEQAYSVDVSQPSRVEITESLAAKPLAASPRRFMKGSVEALDLIRLYPQLAISEALGPIF